MPPRSYEFICKSCWRTVKESADAEVCHDCLLNPAGAAARPAAPPPPPVRKNAPKRSGVTITIRSGPKGGPKK